MKVLAIMCLTISIFILSSCTYNLPPDNNAKILEDNSGVVKSPKSLAALRKALLAGDRNRAQEYELLKGQLDSNTQAMQLKMNAMQDSLVRVNMKLEKQASQIEKKLIDIQVLLYLVLGIIVILMVFLFFRLPSRDKMVGVEKGH